MSATTKMRIFEMLAEMGHEQLVFCRDDASGYRGIIAIHQAADRFAERRMRDGVERLNR